MIKGNLRHFLCMTSLVGSHPQAGFITRFQRAKILPHREQLTHTFFSVRSTSSVTRSVTSSLLVALKLNKKKYKRSCSQPNSRKASPSPPSMEFKLKLTALSIHFEKSPWELSLWSWMGIRRDLSSFVHGSELLIATDEKNEHKSTPWNLPLSSVGIFSESQNPSHEKRSEEWT